MCGVIPTIFAHNHVVCSQKRQVLGTLDALPQVSWGAGPSSNLNTVPEVCKTSREEDWVHQTRDLTIHSPSLANGEHLRLFGNNNADMDVSMVRDISFPLVNKVFNCMSTERI